MLYVYVMDATVVPRPEAYAWMCVLLGAFLAIPCEPGWERYLTRLGGRGPAQVALCGAVNFVTAHHVVLSVCVAIHKTLG